jgi:hypothetical protein
MSAIWLRLMRMRREGPAYFKISRRVVYDVRELDKWLESKRVAS